MVDDRFEPAQVSFHSWLGRPNCGWRTAARTCTSSPRPISSAPPTLRNRRALSNAGAEVVVQPGKSVSVWLIPGKPSRYSLICADHDWDGMIGSITVAE